MLDPYDTTQVPDRLRESLTAYATTGRQTGDFLRAVLENDLFQAARRADSENVRILPAIVAYISEELPADCYGSKSKVETWIEGASLNRAGIAAAGPLDRAPLVGLPVVEGEIIDAEVDLIVTNKSSLDSELDEVWKGLESGLRDPRRPGARDGEE